MLLLFHEQQHWPLGFNLNLYYPHVCACRHEEAVKAPKEEEEVAADAEAVEVAAEEA